MDYYQGYEDAMRQARVTRSTGLIGFFVRTIISILHSALIYVPLLILSYVIAQNMSALYSHDIYTKIGLTIMIGYLLFALVYFLKGVLIGLRNNGSHWWLMLWFFCVTATCGIQAILAQIMFEDAFAARSIANNQIWSWVGAIAIAFFIYSHYQFLSNIAPSVVFWSYRIGFLTVRSTVQVKNNIAPKKSPTYFHNTPMGVSFKKKY